LAVGAGVAGILGKTCRKNPQLAWLLAPVALFELARRGWPSETPATLASILIFVITAGVIGWTHLARRHSS
jgi:hypothetical protein